jgi:hypothetical protein
MLNLTTRVDPAILETARLPPTILVAFKLLQWLP